MAKISEFRASLKTGLVRPNTFQVDLTFPANLVDTALDASALGQFHCKAASLPESTVAPVPVYYRGRSINVAGERDFQPWSITVYNENFLIRDAFEKWLHGINNLGDNTGEVAPSKYSADLYVTQTDRAGKAIKSVKLIHAFPVQLGPIQLDFEANNQVEMFEVTFVYDYYESSGINGSISTI